MNDGMFEAVYARLNAAQREAVDTVYGPVLVIAGPGTGKTQLLSARVAHILKVTDTAPQNILCLTFTENGAMNMRERLMSFIGQAAYNVQIGTYHAFGSTIINRFPEYFTETRLERPIDELAKRQILSDIIDATDYRSPLKQVRHHLGDLVSTISEVKRGLLTPDDLRSIATANLHVISATQPAIAEILAPYTARMPSKLPEATAAFTAIHDELSRISKISTSKKQRSDHRTSAIESLAKLAYADLAEVLVTSGDTKSTKALTAWKNAWLVKDSSNRFKLAGELESRRVAALSDVLEQYEAALADKGYYDFDDMILRAIDVLERNDDLRFTLQEQYQFILLDEFQDTNAAQLRLVELLTNNPASEGKPNVLAVGDDDQAIYAFQGAEVSNMLDFYSLYKDVRVISLSENYRSRAEILEASANIASQIIGRLHVHFSGVTKQLTAHNSTLDSIHITRTSYRSAIAERTAIAAEIASLLQQGVPASHIAVLAPKHRYLEPLVPYLQHRSVLVSYEKRENILDAPVVRELTTMSRLILALQSSNHPLADSLWPEVLSYAFWKFSVGDIWQISWQVKGSQSTWSELLLKSTEFKHAALLMLTLAGRVETESLEYMLDALIGTTDVETHDRVLPNVRSPLRDYYLKNLGEQILYETVTQLTVMRARLREHETGDGKVLTLSDMLELIAAYEAAEQPMLNTSPYSQAAEAVQLMTVFKAKGLEFDHVFLPACDDTVWGSRANSMGNKLTLPANLSPIRHAGSSDDERLRLLYVAMTRARTGLHLSSHERSFSGRSTESIKYFNEVLSIDGQRTIGILPAGFGLVTRDDNEPPSMEALVLNWKQRHYSPPAELNELLRERLKKYQLSPTHLTHFLDLKYSGPESFFLGTLLRFPSAPTVDTCFGNAIHDTLRWVQGELGKHGHIPPTKLTIEHVAQYLAREPLTHTQYSVQLARATHLLTRYLADAPSRFKQGNEAEVSFRDEGVFIGDVHLGGAIDLLEIDKENKTITVVDYKTGRLGNDANKLRLYTLQLYCYKLLVEGSHTYRGFQVQQGRLVFVEPDETDAIVEKEITFTPQELERTKQLLTAMWRCVMALDMPDVSKYGDSLKDMRAFEDALIQLLDTQ